MGNFVKSSLNIREEEKELESAKAELKQKTPANAEELIAKNEVKNGNERRSNRNNQ